METPIVQGIGLNRVDNSVSFVAEEAVHGEVVEDRVKEKGAQVLPEEEGAERDLRTQVLEHNI